MDIHFSTNAPETPCDLSLSECRSMRDMVVELQSIIEHATLNDVITVSLRRPLPPQIALPQAFKTIVDMLKGQQDKRLSLRVFVESEEATAHLYRYLPADQALATAIQIQGTTLRVMTGDIVAVQADAIVNASNTRLQLGGGVSGAIRHAAWASLQDELDRLAATQALTPGDAVLTGSHGLPEVEYIIHVATAEGTEDCVRQGIRNVLAICEAKRLTSAAFPALGSGTGRLPIGTFARILLDEVTAYLDAGGPRCVRDILVVLWTRKDYDCFMEQLHRLLGVPEHTQEGR